MIREMWSGLAMLALAGTALAQEGTLYENAFVWTGEGFEQRDFRIIDDRFAEPGEALEVVDLEGQYVMPPFGEGHTHKFETMWSVASFSRQMFSQGVFYARNPGAYAPFVQQILPQTQQVDTVDVSFAMGGLTAPYGHPEGVYINVMTQYWYQGFERDDFVGHAFHPVATRADIDASLERLQEQGADFVKIFLQNSDTFEERTALLADPEYRAARDYPDYQSIVGMDPQLVSYVVEQAHARGLTVSAHVSNAADFELAVRAHVDEINHMPGASWETGYAMENQLPSREIAELAAQRDIPVVATAAVRLGATPEEHRALVGEVHTAVLERLHEAGVRILIGIDNYGLTTRTEVDYQRQLGILDDLDVLQAWVETGRNIFPNRQIGAIEPGFEASFLLLDANPLDDFTTLDRIILRVKEGQELVLEED